MEWNLIEWDMVDRLDRSNLQSFQHIIIINILLDSILDGQESVNVYCKQLHGDNTAAPFQLPWSQGDDFVDKLDGEKKTKSLRKKNKNVSILDFFHRHLSLLYQQRFKSHFWSKLFAKWFISGFKNLID